MKKLLYYLIVFSISVLPFEVYAAPLYPSESFISQVIATYASENLVIGGYADNSDEAKAMLDQARIDYGCMDVFRGSSAYTFDGVTCVIYYKNTCLKKFIGVSISTPPPEWYNDPNADTDGDGIPDNCDFYPDDWSKSNNYRVAAELVNESTQEIVGRYVMTQYNDYFSTGDWSAENTSGYKTNVYVGGDWYEMPSDCTQSITGMVNASEVPTLNPYVWTGDEYDTTPGPGNEGMPSPGTDYDSPGSTGPGDTGMPIPGTDYTAPSGSETDSQLLNQITKNTESSVRAIKVLNDNQSAANSLLAQNVKNTKSAVDAANIQNQNLTEMSGNLQKIRMNSEMQYAQGETIQGYLASLNTQTGNVETAVNNMSSGLGDKLDSLNNELSDETKWNSSGLPEDQNDYQTVLSDVQATFTETGDISELPENTDMNIGSQSFVSGLFDAESIINDAISGTAINTMLSTDGFSFSGSGSFSWLYKGKTIQFSVTPYQSALNAWGSVILGIAAVCSVLIVFRR